MWYAISWFVVVALLAIWSLGAWAFYSIAAWVVAHAGVPASGLPTGALQLPDWLGPWVPPQLAEALTSMLASFAPAIDSAIAWLPALANGLSIVVWVVWAAGSALLIVLGLALSAAIALLRRPARVKASAIA